MLFLTMLTNSGNEIKSQSILKNDLVKLSILRLYLQAYVPVYSRSEQFLIF